MGVDPTERQVLGHSLHEPERNTEGGRVQPAGEAPGDHVVLERVDELVGQDSLELGVGAGERQDHAALRELRDPSRPLGDEARQRVGLLELAVRGVEDDRLTLLELVAEDAAQSIVGTLRHPGGVERRHALTRVIVDVEVRRAEDFEIERPVLKLVATELGQPRSDGGDQRQGGQQAYRHRSPRFGRPGHPPRQASSSSSSTPGASPQSRSSW